jgi:deoxyribodipyrimidine photolyase-related protein
VVASRLRHLVLVLGDQLDPAAAAFDGFDPKCDAVWMAELEEETTHVRCHKLRIALFFAAMRHFRDELRGRGIEVHYTEIPRRRSRDRGADFTSVLEKDVRELRPQKLVLTRPGDFRVLTSLEEAARKLDVDLEMREDRHFYSSPTEFSEWADGRKQLVQETFYRTLRRKHRILVGEDGEPEGGRWNFDEENRRTFGRQGPGRIRPPRRFAPDALTREVLGMVEARFADHPGSLENFDLPVTPRDALSFLRDFVRYRLPDFGPYEDAMWTCEPFLFHSRLSVALNLKLLDPRECVAAAVAAYRAGRAPLDSVEGFVRQIVGWREFVRGIYWHFMPRYIENNALDCEDRDVPSFFWDGRTEMRCVREGMQSVLDHGYAHHIVRLMVLGLFAQLLGVHPRRFHEWHMALYLDAIDWVSLPNTLGMSQYGDGGIMATKPYCASGAYVKRMSNFCGGCRYDPKQAVGEKACPFTTLYWDFLARHRKRFAANRRMAMQIRNLDRKPATDLAAIRRQAKALRARIDVRNGV